MYLFFFNDTATTEIYTLSLHDALPIYRERGAGGGAVLGAQVEEQRGQAEGGAEHHAGGHVPAAAALDADHRSEEHTSELQSQSNLVCRLLLEKKKTTSSTTSNELLHSS